MNICRTCRTRVRVQCRVPCAGRHGQGQGNDSPVRRAPPRGRKPRAGTCLNVHASSHARDGARRGLLCAVGGVVACMGSRWPGRRAKSLTNRNAAGEHTAASRCAEQRQASWPEAKTIERRINWECQYSCKSFCLPPTRHGTRFPVSFNAHGTREFSECCTFLLSNRYCIPVQSRMRQACVPLDGEPCEYSTANGAVKNRTCSSFAQNEQKYGRRHPDTNPEETVAKSEHLKKKECRPLKKIGKDAVLRSFLDIR